MALSHYHQFFKYCPDSQDPQLPLTPDNQEWLSEDSNVLLTAFLISLPAASFCEILCSEDNELHWDPEKSEDPDPRKVLFEKLREELDKTDNYAFAEFTQETPVGPVYFYVLAGHPIT